MTEFNLSEKKSRKTIDGKIQYSEEDVKELIKLLLNSMWLNKGMKRTILKHAGKELTS